MYCRRCGNSDNKIITQNIEIDGNTVIISSFGICEQCIEPLGIKEYFKLKEWEYIDPKTVKNTLLNFKGKGRLIRR